MDLEVNVTLDANIGSTDTGSIKRHVYVGSPVIVVPFDVEAIIGLQCSGEGVVISKITFPCDRDVSVVVDGGGDTVVSIDLLGDSNLLAIGGCGELEAGGIHAVVKGKLTVGQVTWRGGEANLGISGIVVDGEFTTRQVSSRGG